MWHKSQPRQCQIFAKLVTVLRSLNVLYRVFIRILFLCAQYGTTKLYCWSKNSIKIVQFLLKVCVCKCTACVYLYILVLLKSNACATTRSFTANAFTFIKVNDFHFDLTQKSLYFEMSIISLWIERTSAMLCWTQPIHYLKLSKYISSLHRYTRHTDTDESKHGSKTSFYSRVIQLQISELLFFYWYIMYVDFFSIYTEMFFNVQIIFGNSA